jgi:hypothetical protein
MIKLLPGVYELDDVEVSNIKPNPTSYGKCKANLSRNYKTEKGLKMFFYRTSSYFNPSIIDVEIDKSTGFNKQALSKSTMTCSLFLLKFRIHQCHLLISFVIIIRLKQKARKFVFTSKLDVLKATLLKMKGESTS